MGLKSTIQKIKSYIFFLFSGLKKLSGNKKNVYIELLNIQQNRRMLTLIRFFSAFDYTCILHVPVKRIFRMGFIVQEKSVICGTRKKMKKCNVILSDNIESIPGNFLEDKHVVRINYDVFNFMNDYSRAVFLPISFHPDFLFIKNEIKALALSCNKERKIAAFFAGSMAGDYDRDITKSYFKINTRPEVFSYITENLSKAHLYLPNSYDEFLDRMHSGELKNKVVLIDISKFAIPHGDYFAVLSEAAFFIQMSGFVQPFCHNQIESLAVGAIPITQFPHVFHPNLEHEKDALVFSALSELIQILEKICGNYYSAAQIDAMRTNCLAYYKSNLSFKSVVDGIEKKDTSDLYICASEASII